MRAFQPVFYWPFIAVVRIIVIAVVVLLCYWRAYVYVFPFFVARLQTARLGREHTQEQGDSCGHAGNLGGPALQGRQGQWWTGA